MVRKIAALILIALTFGSCVSSKEIVYFQNTASSNNNNDAQVDNVNSSEFETTLKADDLLLIIVSSPDPIAAAPFNLPVVGIARAGSDVASAGGQQQLQTYLVDRDGNIHFPVLGSLKVAGLTKSQALDMLMAELKKYINQPIVNLRIANYKISVFGEVAKPGSFTLASERISLPEALSMAGDMTIYGLRHEIIVLRDVNGVKTYNSVDITKADFINSPYYYLGQNDVVYVKPNKTRVNSAAIGPNTSIIITSVSLLITIIALLVK